MTIHSTRRGKTTKPVKAEAPLQAPMALPAADNPGQPDAAPTDDYQDAESLLSPPEVIFCEALARGEPPCQASALAGVCDRTGRRWRLRPEIQAAVRARLNDSLGSARAILAQGSARAARSLVELSDSAMVGDSSKVSAAHKVLETAVKFIEVEELERRLSDLEAQIANQPGQLGRRDPS
jgi:hypothetical protein